MLDDGACCARGGLACVCCLESTPGRSMRRATHAPDPAPAARGRPARRRSGAGRTRRCCCARRRCRTSGSPTRGRSPSTPASARPACALLPGCRRCGAAPRRRGARLAVAWTKHFGLQRPSAVCAAERTRRCVAASATSASARGRAACACASSLRRTCLSAAWSSGWPACRARRRACSRASGAARPSPCRRSPARRLPSVH